MSTPSRERRDICIGLKQQTLTIGCAVALAERYKTAPNQHISTGGQGGYEALPM